MTPPNSGFAFAEGCPMGRRPRQGQTDSLTRRPLPVAEPLERVQRFAPARQILRNSSAVQAGFLACIAGSNPDVRTPVLYMQGDEHTEMRRATARYFTPKAVESYAPMIARLADKLVGKLARGGEMNLDDLSLRLAVQVASGVVGLTHSRLPGMEKRIEAFVTTGLDGAPGAALKLTAARSAAMGSAVGLFFALDVKPAIQARRSVPQDDLISYLLERGYGDHEILSECITYATAGMITTREFITLAAYQMLQCPELRASYVHGTEQERHATLHELLRLNPVVTALYRRAEGPVEVDGRIYPPGTTFALDIQAANADPAALGQDAETICPHRTLPRGVQAQGLAFGDGAHRCPGAFLAMKETDMFLRRLLIWNDLKLVQHPTLSYNEIVKGYELRGLRLRLGQRRYKRATHKGSYI